MKSIACRNKSTFLFWTLHSLLIRLLIMSSMYEINIACWNKSTFLFWTLFLNFTLSLYQVVNNAIKVWNKYCLPKWINIFVPNFAFSFDEVVNNVIHVWSQLLVEINQSFCFELCFLTLHSFLIGLLIMASMYEINYLQK